MIKKLVPTEKGLDIGKKELKVPEVNSEQFIRFVLAINPGCYTLVEE